MKLSLFAVLLSVGALSTPAAMASTEPETGTITLNFQGRHLKGLSEVQLKEELQAQHPEINVDELNLLGMQVTGRVNGEDFDKAPMPITNDEVSDPWVLATDGDVELHEVAMDVELMRSGGGAIIIERRRGYDPGLGGRGYYEGRRNRGYYPDYGNRGGGVIIFPGRSGRRDYDRGRDFRPGRDYDRGRDFRPGRGGRDYGPGRGFDGRDRRGPGRGDRGPGPGRRPRFTENQEQMSTPTTQQETSIQ